MNVDHINEVLAEIERFTGRATKLKNETTLITIPSEKGNYEKYYRSGKNTAALKRASMDLSRALSKLRNGDA